MLLFIGSMTLTGSHWLCFFFFLRSLVESSWLMAGQEAASSPSHPTVSELWGGWEEALGRCRGLLAMSGLQDLYKYDACFLFNPFKLKALIIESYNLHNITQDSFFTLFSLIISLHPLLPVLFYILLFMSSCWQRYLAFFLCHFTLDTTQRRKSYSSQKERFSECLLQCQQMTRITLEIYLFFSGEQCCSMHSCQSRKSKRMGHQLVYN